MVFLHYVFVFVFFIREGAFSLKLIISFQSI